MKVEKIDLVWASVSMVIVGVSFRKGRLIEGLLLIYVLMALLFALHIYIVRRKLKNSVAAFATITDYHVSRTKKGFYPVVKYTTESGREITSVYTVEDRRKRFEIGDEEMICYDPDDPMFFYFSGRENELTKDYFLFILIGGIISAVLLAINH